MNLSLINKSINMTHVMIGMFAITGAIVISTSFPITYKLAFFAMPVVIIFFASAPFYALMFLLIIRPELELFSQSGILKFFSAVPIVFVFYIFITSKSFHFSWDRFKYLYIFMLISLCSILWSINIKESLIHILRLLSVASIYLLIFNLIRTRDDGIKMLYCFPLAVIIPLIIGAKQFILSQTYTTDATNLERVPGLFILANSFARFLFVTLFSCIPLYYYDKKKILPLSLLAISTIITIFYLKIRGVFITMLVGCFLLFYFTPRIRKYLWIVIPVSFCVLYPLAVKMFEHLLHPLPHRIYGGESLIWRLDMWSQLFHNAFLIKPLQGFGIGTSLDISARYASSPKLPHNDYLRILIENGIIGFIFFVMFFVSNLRMTYHGLKNMENRYFNLTAFILIFSHIMMSSAANMFYDTDYSTYFFSFLAISDKLNKLDIDD
jgi:O-antigen ligase